MNTTEGVGSIIYITPTFLFPIVIMLNIYFCLIFNISFIKKIRKAKEILIYFSYYGWGEISR